MSLLDRAINSFAKEILDEFVFELDMPWTSDAEYCYIARSDYKRLLNHENTGEELFDTGLTNAKDILLLSREFEGV